jgi:hypothetical protein
VVKGDIRIRFYTNPVRFLVGMHPDRLVGTTKRTSCTIAYYCYVIFFFLRSSSNSMSSAPRRHYKPHRCCVCEPVSPDFLLLLTQASLSSSRFTPSWPPGRVRPVTPLWFQLEVGCWHLFLPSRLRWLHSRRAEVCTY